MICYSAAMDEIDLIELQAEAQQIVKTVQTPIVIMSDGQPSAVLMGCECFDILAEALVLVDDLDRIAGQTVRVCEV